MKLNYKNYLKIGIILIVVYCSSLFLPIANSQTNTTKINTIDLHMFYGQGCAHCSRLQVFLDSIIDKYPTLVIHKYDVYNNDNAVALFQQMSDEYNTAIDGIPTVFINNKVIVGFSNKIGDSIENEIKEFVTSNKIIPATSTDEIVPPIIEKIANGVDEINIDTKNSSSTLVIPVAEIITTTNKLNTTENEILVAAPEKKKIVKNLTIPIIIAAAAVDAINPCAFAVLIILMTAALSITNKKRALKFGLAFTASIYISYFLMGIGLLSILQTSGISHIFYIVVTVLAIIVGLLNIKDYFWYGKVCLMEIPLSWRPAMKKILNSVTTPLGAFVAGFAVSLFELPCTGGPYIVILGLLAKEVTKSTGIFYLLLYNLVFISPLLILSFLIYKGLSTTSKLENIRQKRVRLLHLISGILMLGIAAVMIFSLLKGTV